MHAINADNILSIDESRPMNFILFRVGAHARMMVVSGEDITKEVSFDDSALRDAAARGQA